jgi:hypothetical protein
MGEYMPVVEYALLKCSKDHYDELKHAVICLLLPNAQPSIAIFQFPFVFM